MKELIRFAKAHKKLTCGITATVLGICMAIKGAVDFKNELKEKEK